MGIVSNTLFIIYTVMCFFGLEAVTLVMIIIRHQDAGSTKLLKAARNFVIVSVILGLFYYVTYYRELILGEFAAGVFLRALDAIVFYAMGYSWIKFIDAIIDSHSSKMVWWRKQTERVFIILMLLSASAYIFLIDENYTTHLFWAEILVIALEAILGITVVVFTAAYIRIGYENLVDTSSKRFVVIVSILVNFNNLWNNIVVCAVFLKAVALSKWCTQLYGVTSILLLVINLLTVVYIYKKDFSPVYFGNAQETTKILSEEEALDLTAQKHRLTERERNVMILAYKGLSNPDIAEQLFISRHTVKRHMHNIFEKLDVSTRVELIHLITSQSDNK